jgi:Cytochrome c
LNRLIIRLAAAALLSPAVAVLPIRAADRPEESVGESIYLHGMLSPHTPVVGARVNGGIPTTGAEAACVNCHQRSGLGSREGEIYIPPVTSEYLFHDGSHTGADPLLPYVESIRTRAPYTPATLQRAIRDGVDSDGRQLSYLMPRYALGDREMADLLAYLKKLSVHQSPGITEGILHFATIVTPDADPVKRSGVLDVLRHYVAEYNSFPIGPQPRMWTSGKTVSAKTMYMAHLRWQLHVWQLEGPAETWRAQLEEHLEREPVFAVLSGLGGSNWVPVHRFCEEEEVPCLFPNVEVPVVDEGGFYSLYFSRGVLLEADLIANRLGAEPKAEGLVVDQIYRRGDSGERAAQELAAALRPHGIKVRDHALAPGGKGKGLSAALHDAAGTQALVLWLRSDDVAALGRPPKHAKVFISGLMGGLEDMPLPASWRESTDLAYPFDVPSRRGVRLDYPLGWFHFRHMPIVAEQVQVDTYLACSLVSEVIKQLADSYVRAYFIEQIQGMLEHRLITGYYPHLALSYHERFASKGGYLAHFTPAGTGTRLVADGDWTVP